MRPDEQPLITTHTPFPPENLPVLDPPPPAHSKAAKAYGVFWWASTKDPLPFYLGITDHTLITALQTYHKYSDGTYTLQQYYRNLLNNSFHCTIIQNNITLHQAQKLRHHIYHQTLFQFPFHDEPALKPFFTQKEPDLPPNLNYKSTKPITYPFTLSPENLQFRRTIQSLLKEKLIKQQQNKAYYAKQKAKRKAQREAL